MLEKSPAIAHIINPVQVGPQSDLYVAQPITFESIRVAKDAARRDCDVTVFSAQYAEDRIMVPDFASATPDLDRSMIENYP